MEENHQESIRTVVREVIVDLLTDPAFLIFLAVVFFLIYFKKDLGELLGRVGYAKYEKDGDKVKWEAGQAKEEEEEADEDEENESEEKEEPGEKASSKPDDSEDSEPVSKDDWRFELWKACVLNKHEEAEAAYKKTLEYISDDTEKELLEIEYNEMKIRHFADTKSLGYLESTATDEKKTVRIREAAHYALAKIRSYLKEYDRSNQNYKEAIQLSEASHRIVRYKVNSASNLFFDGQKKKAFSRLEKMLSETDVKTELALVYETLADLHEEDGENFLRALAAEKALECGAENSSNTFSAGYAYSEADFDELSLLHYQKSMKLGGGKTTLNNLAVQYERLNMPVKSVRNYKDAEEKGETLATANLAYRLLDAGFVPQAEEMLRKAAEKEDVHPNVNEALSSIRTRGENEDKREQQAIRKAKILQKYYDKYAENYFTKRDMPTITAKKFSGTDIEVETEFKDGTLTVTWGEKPYSTADYTTPYKFVAKMHNRSGEATFYKEDYMATFLKKERTFEEAGNGYVTVNNDGSLSILRPGQYNKKELKTVEISG